MFLMNKREQQIKALIQSNKEVDASGYLQLENSVAISKNNNEIPKKYAWIDGVQIVHLENNYHFIMVWVSTEKSEEIKGFISSKFTDDDLDKIITEIKKTSINN